LEDPQRIAAITYIENKWIIKRKFLNPIKPYNELLSVKFLSDTVPDFSFSGGGANWGLRSTELKIGIPPMQTENINIGAPVDNFEKESCFVVGLRFVAWSLLFLVITGGLVTLLSGESIWNVLYR
jgi:hypothetical protein